MNRLLRVAGQEKPAATGQRVLLWLALVFMVGTLGAGQGNHPASAPARAQSPEQHLPGQPSRAVGDQSPAPTPTAHVAGVLRTLPLGINAAALAVDEQAQRVFIAMQGVPVGGCGRYAPMTQGSVAVLNSGTGALLRTVPLHTCPGAIAVDSRAGHVFVVAGPNGVVTMLDAVTGTVLRTIPVGPHAAALAVDEAVGRVFVANGADADLPKGSVTVLNSATGDLLRTVPITGAPLSLAVVPSTQRVFVSAAMYPHGAVTVLDAHSGAVLRVVQGSQDVEAVAARAGRVYVVEGSGQHTRALDATTGAVLATLSGTGYFTRLAAVDERTNHIFTLLANAYDTAMIDAATGALLHTTRLVGKGPLGIAIDAQTSRAFVGSVGRPGGNTVGVLDTRSGALLCTIPVGLYPSLLAVDERAGHAFVVNRATAGPDPRTRSTVTVLDAASPCPLARVSSGSTGA